jgi:hypothetical protein
MSILSAPSVHVPSAPATPVPTKGPLRCGSCEREIVGYGALVPCPECGRSDWQRAPWRPFTRA